MSKNDTDNSFTTQNENTSGSEQHTKQSTKSAKTDMVLYKKGEKPAFINICTFTRPVYTAYLRGIEPKGKSALIIFFMAVCVLSMALGISINRLDIVGIALVALIFCGLSLGQPWMMARSRTDTMQQRYHQYQKNITRFYDDHMSMQNLTAHVEASASYDEITRIKETEDFIYMYVGKSCYFVIKTGFSKGEDEIEKFKDFISQKAPDAKNQLKVSR